MWGASLPRVVVVADEPNDEIRRLVEQHLRELLSEEGGLQRFLESGRQMKAQLEGQLLRVEAQLTGSVELTDNVGISDSVETVLTPGPAELNLQGASPVVRVLQGASPGLVNDLKGRGPRDIKLAIDFWNAFWVAVTAGLTLWGILHPQQPLPQEQITQIFNQATTVIQQIINAPPPTPPPLPPPSP